MAELKYASAIQKTLKSSDHGPLPSTGPYAMKMTAERRQDAVNKLGFRDSVESVEMVLPVGMLMQAIASNNYNIFALPMIITSSVGTIVRAEVLSLLENGIAIRWHDIYVQSQDIAIREDVTRYSSLYLMLSDARKGASASYVPKSALEDCNFVPGSTVYVIVQSTCSDIGDVVLHNIKPPLPVLSDADRDAIESLSSRGIMLGTAVNLTDRAEVMKQLVTNMDDSRIKQFEDESNRVSSLFNVVKNARLSKKKVTVLDFLQVDRTFSNPHTTSTLVKLLHLNDRDTYYDTRINDVRTGHDHTSLRKAQNASWSLDVVAKGMAAYNNKDYIEAMKQFKYALDIDNECANAYVGEGACHMRIGRVVDAKICFERALRIKPDDVTASKYLQMCEASAPGPSGTLTGPGTPGGDDAGSTRKVTRLDRVRQMAGISDSAAIDYSYEHKSRDTDHHRSRHDHRHHHH